MDSVVGQVPTKILLDTGANVSVAQYDFLQDEHQKRLSASPGAVGANGTPLDVVGKVPVSLGPFNAEEEFTVTRNLAVDCLLVADFLQKHGDVMDCRSSTLSIGISSRHCVPMFLGQQQSKCDSSMTIVAPVKMDIPGRTIQLIQGELKGDPGGFSEALVEPENGGPPRNLCIARTLSPVSSGKKIIIQVMNMSPTPVTVYGGMKLGEAVPRTVFLVDDVPEMADTTQTDHPAPVIDLNNTNLSPSEKTQLYNLLTKFANVFAPKGGPVGRTQSVKQSISMTGPPV